MRANWLRLIDNNHYFSRNNQHDYELFECCLNGAAVNELSFESDGLKNIMKSISLWFVQ